MPGKTIKKLSDSVGEETPSKAHVRPPVEWGDLRVDVVPVGCLLGWKGSQRF